MNIEYAQIFTQIISFLIVLWVLKRYAWKPLLTVLEDREKKIQTEFDTIDNQKKENERLLQLYQEKLQNADKEIKELLKEGRESGLKLAKEIEDKATGEAKKIIAQTKEEVQKEIVKAKSQLKEEMVKITLMATEKVMKEQMNSDKQKTLVEEFIHDR